MGKIASVQVEKVELTTEVERRVALATVRLGEVVIRGVAVWKSPRGKLRVFVPSRIAASSESNHAYIEVPGTTRQL
jgi:hypothetical protein